MQLFKKFFAALHDGTFRSIWIETVWVYRRTQRYRKVVLLYVLLGLLATALSLLSTLASKELINAIVYLNGGGHRVAYTGVLVVLLAVGNIVLSAFVNRYSAKINLRISNEMRAEVYSTFMNTDWESLQRFHSGDLLSRINADVSTVSSSVLGWVPTLIIKLAQFAASLVVILCYDPTMALLALISAPVSLIVSKPFVSKMRNLSKDMRSVSSEMMAFHEETLQNIQPIKAFNLVDAFCARLDTVQKKHYDTSMSFNRFSILTSSLLSACGLIVRYLCLGWGAYRLWLGKIDFGTMVLFIQLAGYLSSSLNALINLVPGAVECAVSAQRLMSVFELPRETMEHLDTVASLRRQNAPLNLHIDQLQFSYQSRDLVLDSLQLSVCPREMIAIVGPSGSGKTTLFRILLGILQPTSGIAEIVSGAMHIPLSPSTRSLFAYVPQDNVIFSGTVADTLRMVQPDATEEDIFAALRVACAEEFVRKLPNGIDSPLGERGASLSEGQNQRLAIARAVLADAPILLLDEVTSALDLETEQQVLQNIAGLKDKTCIISTHRPSVLSLCDRIYRIRHTHLEPLPEEELKKMQSNLS